MKKFLTILILGFLTCNISFADSLRIVDGDTIVLNGEKIFVVEFVHEKAFRDYNSRFVVVQYSYC